MPRGGARPGAGRPKGKTDKPKPPGSGRKPKRKVYASPIREAEGKVRDRLPELVDVALSLAIDDRNERMVIYCIDRILGKPSQPIDLDVRRAADRLASATGADPEFLIRRAQQIAAENAEPVAQ